MLQEEGKWIHGVQQRHKITTAEDNPQQSSKIQTCIALPEQSDLITDMHPTGRGFTSCNVQ